jgi:Zn-finger nucleic acid-binding protein
MAETQNEDGVQVAAETLKVCPVCQAMLSDGTIQNRSVLYCTKCRGLLISIDKFLPLVEFLRALRRPTGSNIEPRDNTDADRHLICPLCDKTMIGHPYGGPGNVNVDNCEACSVIWLDHDELQRIVMAPDHYPVYSRYDSGGGLRR